MRHFVAVALLNYRLPVENPCFDVFRSFGPWFHDIFVLQIQIVLTVAQGASHLSFEVFVSLSNGGHLCAALGVDSCGASACAIHVGNCRVHVEMAAQDTQDELAFFFAERFDPNLFVKLGVLRRIVTLPTSMAGRASYWLRSPANLQVGNQLLGVSGTVAVLRINFNVRVEQLRQLGLRLDLSNGQCTSVGVGQIARGHRYAYQAVGAKTRGAGKFPITLHSALDILLHPETGLITSKQGGIHIIPTTEPIVAFAILGKLYSENVVLLPENCNLDQVENTGKEFEPKFVIWDRI